MSHAENPIQKTDFASHVQPLLSVAGNKIWAAQAVLKTSWDPAAPYGQLDLRGKHRLGKGARRAWSNVLLQ